MRDRTGTGLHNCIAAKRLLKIPKLTNLQSIDIRRDKEEAEKKRATTLGASETCGLYRKVCDQSLHSNTKCRFSDGIQATGRGNCPAWGKNMVFARITFTFHLSVSPPQRWSDVETHLTEREQTECRFRWKERMLQLKCWWTGKKSNSSQIPGASVVVASVNALPNITCRPIGTRPVMRDDVKLYPVGDQS